MTDTSDPTWKPNESGRRANTDRDRLLSDEEAVAYDKYIRPIMRARATAVIEKYNAVELALDPDVRLSRERSNDQYKKRKRLGS